MCIWKRMITGTVIVGNLDMIMIMTLNTAIVLPHHVVNIVATVAVVVVVATIAVPVIAIVAEEIYAMMISEFDWLVYRMGLTIVFTNFYGVTLRFR